jgi:hypothetical protein
LFALPGFILLDKKGQIRYFAFGGRDEAFKKGYNIHHLVSELFNLNSCLYRTIYMDGVKFGEAYKGNIGFSTTFTAAKFNVGQFSVCVASSRLASNVPE